MRFTYSCFVVCLSKGYQTANYTTKAKYVFADFSVKFEYLTFVIIYKQLPVISVVIWFLSLCQTEGMFRCEWPVTLMLPPTNRKCGLRKHDPLMFLKLELLL